MSIRQQYSSAVNIRISLHGIDFQAEPGQMIALVGKSGSGKSSILKAVAGLNPPVAGRIGLGGGEALAPNVDRRPPEHLRRKLYRTTQHVIRCVNITNRGRDVAVPHELH